MATIFVKWFGKSTLGLAYGLAAAEALLAPAMPSTTARAGGIFMPIINSLARTSGSMPGAFISPLGIMKPLELAGWSVRHHGQGQYPMRYEFQGGPFMLLFEPSAAGLIKSGTGMRYAPIAWRGQTCQSWFAEQVALMSRSDLLSWGH